MDLSPIEELRARLVRTAARRGMRSPSTLRISRLLDRLIVEWYSFASPTACGMESAPEPFTPEKRADLVRRYQEVNAKNDMAGYAALLAEIRELPLDDPDRPQMLLCAAWGSHYTRPDRPEVAWAAYEEVAATATPYSLVHLKALGNLSYLYMSTGRFHAGFRLVRFLDKNLHRFERGETIRNSICWQQVFIGKWLGKLRLARRALHRAFALPNLREQSYIQLEVYRFVLDSRELPLPVMKQTFRQIWAKHQCGNLLAGYCGALARSGHPRAAIVVGKRALAQMAQEHLLYQMNQVDVNVILAAASQMIGDESAMEACLETARTMLGPFGEQTCPVATRMRIWLPTNSTD